MCNNYCNTNTTVNTMSAEKIRLPSPQNIFLTKYTKSEKQKHEMSQHDEMFHAIAHFSEQDLLCNPPNMMSHIHATHRCTQLETWVLRIRLHECKKDHVSIPFSKWRHPLRSTVCRSFVPTKPLCGFSKSDKHIHRLPNMTEAC